MEHKVVVFDVDETLGYFVQFGILWDVLSQCQYIDSSKKQKAFNECFGLYPEFIRPNMIPILAYLKHKVDLKHCKKVMIYTNNQGPPDWVPCILTFFEEKIGFSLFSNIISAFKKKGKQIELGRTSHKKSHEDLIECSKISPDTQICFIDDTYYPRMTHDNIFYIKVKPYIHMIQFDEIIDRVVSRKLEHITFGEDSKDTVRKKLTKGIKEFSFSYESLSKEEYDIDKIVSKQMMLHIQEFFS
jgi:hypothetical protein